MRGALRHANHAAFAMLVIDNRKPVFIDTYRAVGTKTAAYPPASMAAVIFDNRALSTP